MTDTKPIYIVGAGGHAKVVISSALECGIPIRKVLDDDSRKWGSCCLGKKICGPIEKYLHDTEQPHAIIAIGCNHTRKRISERFPNTYWETIIHPKAYVHSSAKIDSGSVIFPQSTVQPDVSIGKHSIINTNCSVDHDSSIGSFCHVAPGATLAGGITIDDGTLIGVGASILPNLKVGKQCIIGAGALVCSDVSLKKKVFGIPAK